MGDIASPNRVQLVRTARRLVSLLDRFVFVGGHMAELLVTDPGTARPRQTDDVDVVVTVTTKAAYQRLVEEVMVLGFQPDTSEGAPICRYRARDPERAGDQALVLDVMSVEEDVLGFSNLWYPYATESAQLYRLAPDLAIHGASAPAFLATKWAAFADRGAGDYLASHDVEDVLAVIAGRPAVTAEVALAPWNVRRFIAQATRGFLDDSWADDVLAAAVPDAREFPELLRAAEARLRALAEPPSEAA